MMRVTILMVVLLVFVVAGSVRAELSDKQKAVQLARCTADCQALQALDPNPDWARLANGSFIEFSVHAFRLYDGPDKDIKRFWHEREAELLSIYNEEGRPALVEDARAAFEACAEIYWELLTKSREK